MDGKRTGLSIRPYTDGFMQDLGPPGHPTTGAPPGLVPMPRSKAALIEWIKKETFTKPNGSYIVDESGVVRPGYRYWNLRELCHCEVRRIHLPRTTVNTGWKRRRRTGACGMPCSSAKQRSSEVLLVLQWVSSLSRRTTPSAVSLRWSHPGRAGCLPNPSPPCSPQPCRLLPSVGCCWG